MYTSGKFRFSVYDIMVCGFPIICIFYFCFSTISYDDEHVVARRRSNLEENRWSGWGGERTIEINPPPPLGPRS